MNIRSSTYSDGIQEWVESQTERGGSSVAKGNAFCQWVLENVFEVTSDEALDAQNTSGSRDHSIDAIILAEESIAVIQTKYDTAHDISEVTKFHYDMCRIRNGKSIDDNLANDAAQRAIADILDGYDMGWDIKYYYVTNANFTQTEKQKIKDLEGCGAEFFFYDISLIAEKLDRRQQDVPDTVKGKWFNLPLSNRDILTFENTTAVIAVSLNDVYKFVEHCGNDLFASNVRQYLRKTKINSGIIETITKSPEDFWLYNNGITIVCDDFVEESFTFKLQTPQIVNGCQTARSIWEVFSKKTGNLRESIKGHVLVRIIKDPDEKKKDLITRYTNTQNAVRGKDFFSLEQFHKKLQKNFEKHGYYYEIQRGAFTALKASERSKYVGIEAFSYLVDNKFKNLIPASEATQAFAAAFRNVPAVAYAGSDKLTPSGPAYDDIFDETLKPEAELFLYPYLIRIWAQANGYGRGATGGWRAHSVLFFVHTYFAILLEILRTRNVIDPLEVQTDKVPLEVWHKIFMDENLNLNLVSLVDDILERYFSDSKVDEAVGQDIRKFLRSQEMLNRHNSILVRIIEIVALSSPRNAKLIDRVQQVVS